MSGRHVVLGVSASIAIHRGLDIASELRKRGDSVSVLMTPSATRLIAPQTFQAIALGPVFHTFWDEGEHHHIELARDIDLMCIAPATANTIGKLAHGILDTVLTATATAFDGPRFLAPAMNWRMWAAPAVQENVERLKGYGWTVIPPADGDLACGEQGPGRLAAVSDILQAIS